MYTSTKGREYTEKRGEASNDMSFRNWSITAWEFVIERSSCSFSYRTAFLCSLETMAVSLPSPLTPYKLWVCLKRRKEPSNPYDHLFTSHMSASVSSQKLYNIYRKLPKYPCHCQRSVMINYLWMYSENVNWNLHATTYIFLTITSNHMPFFFFYI